MYNVVFPCVIMSALTLLVFCLPPDSGEKVTMGITVLLSFSVFLLRMGEDLPETSEFIPLLSKFYRQSVICDKRPEVPCKKQQVLPYLCVKQLLAKAKS